MNLNGEQITNLEEDDTKKVRRKFIEQVIPLKKEVQFSTELFSAIKELQLFLPIVAHDLSKDPSLIVKLFRLSKLNRGSYVIKDKIASLKKDDDDIVKTQAQEKSDIRNEIKNQIQTKFDNIFKIIDLMPGDANTDAVINAFVDTVADYLNFKSKTAKLNDKMYSLYYGIGAGIDTRIIDKRLPNQVISAAGYRDKKFVDKDAKVKTDHDKLVTMQTQMEENLKVTLLEKDIRVLEFNNWLHISSQKEKRIAGTPWDEQNIQAILESRRLNNGTGGALLYGPPGTGKTELIIEANSRMGFETHVVSLHEFSGFVQLIGEAPVQLTGGQNLDKTTKISNFKEAIKAMTDQEFAEAVMSLNLSEQQLSSYIGKPQKTDEKNPDNLLLKLKQELILDSNKAILAIELADEDGITQEQAWTKGEILEAWSQGKQVLLDEADKAGPEAFSGISYILAAKPGTTIQLRGYDYTIPPWARIDTSANAMKVDSFLQNRFAPSILEIDYPPTDDLMKKVALWLSNSEGKIDMSFDAQSKIVTFFSYVVPRIQHLYAVQEENGSGGISNPLSYRNMIKMCQSLIASKGENLAKVIDKFILTKGALVNNDSELLLLQGIIDDFPLITVSNIQFHEPSIQKGILSILESPLLDAATVGDGRPNSNQGQFSGEITLDDSQREQLIQSKSIIMDHSNELEVEFNYDIQYLPNGITVEIDRHERVINFVDSEGKITISRGLPEHLNDASLIGADDHGTNLLFQINRKNSKEIIIHSLLRKSGDNDKYKHQRKYSDTALVHLSRDGGKIISLLDNHFQLEILDEKEKAVIVDVYKSGSKEAVKVSRWSLNEDESLLLLETNDGLTYILNTHSIVTQRKMTLETPINFDQFDSEIPQIGWELGSNNILFNPINKKGFVIK
jgi:MoxR-like ATPase